MTMTNKTCFPNAIELIDMIFDFVVTGAAKDYLRLDLGQITSELAEIIAETTPFNLEHYRISIDSHGIRHILNKHGTAQKENLRGQKHIQKRDLWKLPQIIDFSDKIEVIGKSAIGNDLLVFEKTIDNNRYVTIWEIRTVTSLKKQAKKQSRIVLHTFYIR